MKCLATAAAGSDGVVADELAALGVESAERVPGGVAFECDVAHLYRALLGLRATNRLLVEVGRFNAFTHDRLYAGVKRIAWEGWFDPDATLAVDVHLSGDNRWVQHGGFTVLRVKDAICDRLREATGRRPSIDKRHPAVRVHARIRANRAAIYLDASGEPLFKRGWRVADHPAHLRETLAAAIVQLAGWRGDRPLFDPLCGSGTLLIEAALIAARIAPGLAPGRRYACQRWRTFEPEVWEQAVAAAREQIDLNRCPAIVGSDLDPAAVAATRANAEAAGVGEVVRVAEAEVGAALPPAGPGVLITNPPYGERIGDKRALAALYADLGHLLKGRCPGWEAFLLSGDRDLTRHLHLKASRRWPLRNGPIDCRLLRYEVR